MIAEKYAGKNCHRQNDDIDQSRTDPGIGCTGGDQYSDTAESNVSCQENQYQCRQTPLNGDMEISKCKGNQNKGFDNCDRQPGHENADQEL